MVAQVGTDIDCILGVWLGLRRRPQFCQAEGLFEASGGASYDEGTQAVRCSSALEPLRWLGNSGWQVCHRCGGAALFAVKTSGSDWSIRRVKLDSQAVAICTA